MKEIWKDIKGYEGLYQVSNLGRIKSLIGHEKILKSYNKNSKDKTSYLKIILSKNSKTKAYLIHRLVAITFIPNLDNLPEINHKDENKLNNKVDNLEWCTRKYNIEYSKAKHLDSFNNYGIKVYCLDLDKYFESASKASVQTGVCRTSILKACRGQLKSAGGMLWCYAKDKDKKFAPS